MLDRRDFLKLLGSGAVVTMASSLAGCAGRGARAPSAGSLRDFAIVQISDTHWGYRGADDPEAELVLPRIVSAVEALGPAIVVHTGDVTQKTDDPGVRRSRLREARAILGHLTTPDVRFLAGEHDAAADAGAAFGEAIGPLRWSFDHEGVHLIGLDNVSDPAAIVGDAQIDWLARDVAALPRDAPILVFAHRPLFSLVPEWDWDTKDGAKALDVLSSHRNVTVFYGHIHQEHHQLVGGVAHHAARSLVFPLPAPGSTKVKKPLPWSAEDPSHGLGFRTIDERAGAPALTERPYAPPAT